MRRSARISGRSVPYVGSSLQGAAEDVDDDECSEGDGPDAGSTVQLDAESYRFTNFSYANLPRRSPYVGFVPPRVLDSDCGSSFFVAVVPEWVRGGRMRDGRVLSETILIRFTEEALHFEACRYGRLHVMQNLLYWLGSDSIARPVNLRRRGDTEESLGLTYYREDGRQCWLLVHRVLGFTFKCSPAVWRTCARFSQSTADFLVRRCSEYEVHHVNHDHGCNFISNLRVITLQEHRAITAEHRRLIAQVEQTHSTNKSCRLRLSC